MNMFDVDPSHVYRRGKTASKTLRNRRNLLRSKNTFRAKLLDNDIKKLNTAQRKRGEFSFGSTF